MECKYKCKLITNVRCDLFVEKSTKEYISALKKNKYSIPAITMIIILSIAIGITLMVKSIVSTNTEELSIATNTAEAAFYNRKYDTAIAGYTELQGKEDWPIWNAKIAEIYSVKGDFVKSNEILQRVYETRNKIVDTKKEEMDTLEVKDRELTNDIVFTALMNGENKKALEYGEIFLQYYPNDKNLLKTMFTVYIL
jgi:tetratricopeptide (TPR) repeat protein